MKHIYYIFALWYIFTEISWIFNPLEKTKDMFRFKELNKEQKGLKWDDYSNEYKDQLKSKFWLLFLIAWMFLGLFTFQWFAFLIFLIFHFGIVGIISRAAYPNVYMYATFHIIFSFIGLLFGLFFIINAFHLKIDSIEMLRYLGLNI